MKVLIVASEAFPYAKSGGLGDVCGSLPAALRQLGADARLVVPRYKNIDAETLKGAKLIDTFDLSLQWRTQKVNILELVNGVYLIENDFYFGRDGYYGYGDDNERFAFFSRACLALMASADFFPDVVHCNDWQTGPVCMYLKSALYHKHMLYKNVKSLFTIHNMQHQGVFPYDTINMMGLSHDYFNENAAEFYGQVNYMKAGLNFADALSTVSETYAAEIQTPEYGWNLNGVLERRKNDLYGILNGLDYELNNPATDPYIAKQYDKNTIDLKKENKWALQRELSLPEIDVPVVSIVSRLAEQKGFGLVTNILERILNETEAQFVLLGTGEWNYESFFKHLAYKYPHKLKANIMFDNGLAQKIYAGSDLFLMPSLFEPCGLGQLIALRYGTIPIARRTGGLTDTVYQYNQYTKEGTGFLFDAATPSALYDTIHYALSVYYDSGSFRRIIYNAMNMDFSWNESAKKYLALYEKITEAV